MYEQLLTGALFIWLIYGLAFSRWNAALVFSVCALACLVFDLVETEELLRKAGNPGLMTLILLLLVSAGLEKLTWLKDLAGLLVAKGYRQSLLRVGAAAAGFSAFINNTAVVATLANSLRGNPRHPASKLLIPLSYMAILGGTTTLIGTSTNLIVSGFLEDATGEGLAFFAFLPVGIAAAAAGLLALLATGRRTLPSHPGEAVAVAEYLIETEVSPDSALIGKSIAENRLRDLDALFLVEIVRGEHLISPVSPSEVIEAGDKLIFSGDIARLNALDSFPGLTLFAVEEGLLAQNLTEVIVMPNATIEGESIKNSRFRSLFDAAVVGLHRGGKRLSGKLGDIIIEAGDRLMLAAGPDFRGRRNLDKNFFTMQDNIKANGISGWENYLATAGLLAVVALAALGLFPLLKGLALLLALMLLMGTVQADELRRRFPFELWLIIASALIWAQALHDSGLVQQVAGGLHGQLEGFGPHAAVAAVFLLTLAMTELMTNNAAAALCFPIAFGLAESYGLSYMPFVMAVAYGASASFLTPYGYTTNLMVQNLGNYGFRDYVRAGLPVSLAYSCTAVYLIPKVFPF